VQLAETTPPLRYRVKEHFGLGEEVTCPTEGEGREGVRGAGRKEAARGSWMVRKIREKTGDRTSEEEATSGRSKRSQTNSNETQRLARLGA